MKYSVVKGCRDFLPHEMLKRNYIFNTLRNIFGLHGFLPIETPSMEGLSTLMGKYGEEGDKLLFKILNSGDFLREVDLSRIDDYKKLLPKISDKGLRYDLTVPFARFVVNHRNDITFPFRRYQIQPVWRADRPQKGRYREFYQCDVDIIGSSSLLNEVELVEIVDESFAAFNLPVTIKINNRKILSAMAILIGQEGKVTDLTVAIDKYDKIGIEGVKKELLEKGFTPFAIEHIEPIVLLQGSVEEKLQTLKTLFKDISVGIKGVEELEAVFGQLTRSHLANETDLDLTLARGLNYYTGAIFEVKAKDVEMGSVCGGGRYDNLTGIFGLPDVSGVGISFGADRIYDCLNEKQLFPKNLLQNTQVFCVNFGGEEEQATLAFAKAARLSGISTEVYPEDAKMKKQMNYANAQNIPFVVLIGENERKEGLVTLKNMTTGEQMAFTASEAIEKIKKMQVDA